MPETGHNHRACLSLPFVESISVFITRLGTHALGFSEHMKLTQSVC